MKTHIIQLERHDDAISTRDKMAWGRSQRILLVFPEKGSILNRRVDLVLLQRHSQALGAQLALVAGIPDVCQNARDLGIPVFKSVIQAQKSPWRVPREVRRKLWRRLPQRLSLEELRSCLVKPDQKTPLGVRLTFFCLGIAAVLALAAFILPGVTISLAMSEQDQHIRMDVWANPNVVSPSLSGGIPARIVHVEVEGTDIARSTGRTILANRAATGEVTFVNLTDREVQVLAGTIVRTQSNPPVRFETTASAVLTADENNRVNVPVRAILAGISGNVDAGEIVGIEGAVGSLLVVTNQAGTSGGSEQFSPAPSTDDYHQARQRLKEILRQQAEAQMKAELPQDTYLLLPSITLAEVILEDRQPEEGQPGDQFTLSMKAAFTGWVITADDIREVAQMALDANMPPGYTTLPDTLTITLLGQPVSTGNNIRYHFKADRRLAARWTREEVVRLVRGKDLPGAVQLIQETLPLRSMPTIEMTPEWWPRMPYLPFRIQVGSQ